MTWSVGEDRYLTEAARVVRVGCALGSGFVAGTDPVLGAEHLSVTESMNRQLSAAVEQGVARAGCVAESDQALRVTWALPVKPLSRARDWITAGVVLMVSGLFSVRKRSVRGVGVEIGRAPGRLVGV